MRRLLFEWCLITAAAIAIIAGLLTSRATDRIDNVFYDVLVGLRAPAPSDRILLVVIDDTSVAAIGRWPWPRSVHAGMLERLAGARPAVVAYDVLFTEPGEPDDDAQLGAAMRTLGNVAVPVLFEAPGRDGRTIDATLPIAPVADGARLIGHVALLPDEDGIARTVPIALQGGRRQWPHLMEATYRTALGHPSAIATRLARHGDPRARIPFQPGGGSFRAISFSSVLAGEVPPEFVRDRIILVGATAAGLGDRFRVPTLTGGLISGIELQANLLNSLLADRLIVEPGLAVRLAAGLAPTLALLIAFWWLRPARALAAGLSLLALALAVPVLLLLLADLWLPPTPSLIGLLLVYPLWGWRRLQAVDRAIGQELSAFAAEPTPVPVAAGPSELLDPVGGQTARLRAAIASMRDLRRLVSDTIDGVNDPLLVTDLDDRVILASRTAAALFEGDIENVKAASLLSARAGREIVPDALPAELHFAPDRVFSLRRFPLRTHAGEQRGWILHLSDISDIRRAEREREEMLEFLSHDMRSPQASIITLLERHRNSIADTTLAERITNLARKTLTLADNFVQLARFSVASFEPEEVNLTDVLTEAADELWPLASRRKVQITVDEGEMPCFLLGDRDELARALINLLDNAVKFSPEGGVVRCSVAADGKTVRCLIEDDGPGIPPERLEALFARFGHRKQAGGPRLSAGLGLAYVKAVVERHGGTIACEPRKPHGTRFILGFPNGE